jgi:DNA repair exonuclease SbcCD ATPase subunit
MVEWTAIPGEIVRLTERIESAESSLAGIVPDEPLIDIAELRSRYERALESRNAVAAATEAAEKLAGLKEDLNAARITLQDHTECRPDEASDKTEALRDNQSIIDSLAGAPERVAACERAKADAERRRHELDGAHGKLTIAKLTLATASQIGDEAARLLQGRESARINAQSAIDRTGLLVDQSRQVIESLTRSIAGRESTIRALEARQAECTAKRARMDEKRAERDRLTDLRLFAGPRGFRQIYIDSVAAPELGAIMDDLSDRATGGQIRVRIATQTSDAKGNLKEDFAILVRDAAGRECDVLDYSGGERQIVMMIVRFAICMWIARTNKATINLMVMDEPITAAGGTSKVLTQFFELLDFIATEIPQLFIITHLEGIWRRMASRVELRKGIMGAKIVTEGKDR